MAGPWLLPQDTDFVGLEWSLETCILLAPLMILKPVMHDYSLRNTETVHAKNT